MCWCKAGYQTQEECKSPSLLFKDSPSAGGRSQLSRPEGRAPPCDLHGPSQVYQVESDGVFGVDWPTITKDECGGTCDIQGNH